MNLCSVFAKFAFLFPVLCTLALSTWQSADQSKVSEGIILRQSKRQQAEDQAAANRERKRKGQSEKRSRLTEMVTKGAINK